MSGQPRIIQDTLGILGVRGYSDTGVLAMGGHPRIVRDTLGILGVHGYSDMGGVLWVSLVYMDTQTWGVSHEWTTLDNPRYSGYPRCTWILRHRREVATSSDSLGYSDTGGLAMGGHPRIVQDILGIHGVRGYSDTGVGHS